MITDMKDAKIFSPLQLGRTTLKNRIAMGHIFVKAPWSRLLENNYNLK